jgi:hypothetical protein
MKSLAVCSLLLAAALVARAENPYADSVVIYTAGTGINSAYVTASAALGGPTVAATITAPAFSKNDIVGVGNGGQLTLGFSTPITNDPAGHAGGMDFTIFGNEFFTFTGGGISGVFNHTGLTVSVSQDNLTYYLLDAPYGADDYYPTQGNGNPFLPVNPSLTLASFQGKTSAQALTLYNGSSGGASYSLSWAEDTNGNHVDLTSVSYIRIEGTAGFGYIDSVARVQAIPEPSSLALMGFGIGFLLIHQRRRFRARTVA